MKSLVLRLLAIVAAWPPAVGAQPAAPLQSPLTPRDSAWHALNRLAYGPRPGEIERVAAGRAARLTDAQPPPDKTDDETVAKTERAVHPPQNDPGDPATLYPEQPRAPPGPNR